MNRYAVISCKRDSVETVKRYLPGNYETLGMAQSDGALIEMLERVNADLAYVIKHDGPHVVVGGEDVAGWTMDLYVLPRLGSGLIGAREITAADAQQLLGAVLPPDGHV